MTDNQTDVHDNTAANVANGDAASLADAATTDQASQVADVVATSLISSDQHWILWAIIIIGVAISIYLEQTYRWAARVSGPLLALGIAMILANMGVVPESSPVYDVVYSQIVPLAIPLLLFKANIFSILRSSKSLFLSFHIAAVGTIMGAIAAVLVMGRQMEYAAESAGIMAGSYIGGGVNFVAVSSSFEVPSEVTGPLLIADNFIMAGVFALLLAASVSKFFLRQYPHPHTKAVDPQAAANLAAEHWKRKEIGLLDIAKALAIAFGVTALAMTLNNTFSEQISNSFILTILLNPFVIITFTMLLLATLFHKPMGRIRGAEEMGTFLLYMFLFVIGLPADLMYVLRETPNMFLFCLIIATANVIVAFGVCRLLKLNLEETIIAVNITLGGPPTGAAFAIAKGWSQLIVPALLVGIWGYVIGTAIGITLGHGMLRWLGS